MRTRIVSAIAIIAATTIGLGPATARAQATLGFEIDKTEGFVGDTVNGTVDTDDIAANCSDTLTEVQDSFLPLLTLLQDPAFIELYFPGTGGDISNPQNYEQLSYFFIAITSLAINFNILNAAQQVLNQAFVLTFAEIATETPVGPRSTFDAVTGLGSINVPDLAPGPWGVAATCVGPHLDLIEEAITAGATFLEGEGIPVPLPPDFDLFGTLAMVGPGLLTPMMQPVALGAQIFNILAPGALDLDHGAAFRRGSKPAKISLKGTFQTGLITVDDVVSAANGFTINVTDGLTMNETGEVAPGDCTTKKGKVSCTNADKTVTAKFTPVKNAPGKYAFKIQMTGLEFGAPQAAPLTVALDYGIPRTGSNASCKVHNTKLVCKD